MKNTILSACYLLISVVYICFGSMTSPLPALILKALIIPVLFLLLILNINLADKRSHQMIFLALLFSWFGDILLGVPVNIADLFIPGLVSFLLAQLMYIAVFFKTPGDNFILKERIFTAVPLILYGLILLYLLFEKLGDLKIPVVIYTIAILTMVFSAMNRFGKVGTISWITVLSGAILFLLSDSGIAINRFLHPFRGAQPLIMSTYVLAQYLIVVGYLKEHSFSALSITSRHIRPL